MQYNKKQFFKDNGYIVLKNFFSKSEIQTFKDISLLIKNDTSESYVRHDGRQLTNSDIDGGITKHYRSGIINIHTNKFGLGKKFSENFKNFFCTKKSFDLLNQIFNYEKLTIHQTILFYTSPLTVPHLDRMSLDTWPMGYSFTCWLAIDKSTKNNGAVYVLPNQVGKFNDNLENNKDIISYRNAFAKDFEKHKDKIIIPILNPGDLLVFASSTPHGSLEPLKELERCGMQIIIRSTSTNKWGKFPNHDEIHNVESEEKVINKYFNYLNV